MILKSTMASNEDVAHNFKSVQLLRFLYLIKITSMGTTNKACIAIEDTRIPGTHVNWDANTVEYLDSIYNLLKGKQCDIDAR